MAFYQSDILIIGSGPAGYTASIYASRTGKTSYLVSGDEVGGQLTLSNDIENYPGFEEAITGIALMERMKKQALNLGAKIINDKIVEVDFAHYPFECSSQNHNVFYAKSIIIATGASAKWLEIESEEQYKGYGISVCATCDGFFYKNKDVAVIGGGNSAVDEALYLANFARSVTIIHRREALRADEKAQEKIKQHPKISIKYDVTVEKFIGEGQNLKAIKIKNVKNDKEEIIKIDGAFIAIGHKPNTEFLRGEINLDDNGYIITQPDSCKTNIEGVFACGDVKDPKFRQAIIAAGSGAMAAIEASRWLGK
jgi:thioredoxin reductase (NADPH)